MKLKDRRILNKVLVLFPLIGFIICAAIYSIDKDKSSLMTFTTNQDKVIYLTFDDGPSYKVTNEILDILKEKGVKATFFVVGYKIQGREEILKRIKVEGSSIGLHTYTHNYKKIYSSEKSFIDEMNKTRDEVKQVTGVISNIIRFPAGSKPYLNTSLLNKLHAENYRIYDWNATLSDGLDCKTSPGKLLKESTRVIGRASKVFLLLHCDEVNENTCKALPQIIDSFKQQGYVFKVITDATPEFHFRLNKR